jgi:uncharacterized protein (TIGR03067 family)
MLWLVLGLGVVPALAQAADPPQPDLQGTWTATSATRDGKPADDVVGHQLSFAGHRFHIRDGHGKPLNEGTFRVDTNTTPATIDFEHATGALEGKVWKGIYAVHDGTLRICDNAPDLDKDRPVEFEAGAGSGYVLITFDRTRP